jgi:hypothetical protein
MKKQRDISSQWEDLEVMKKRTIGMFEGLGGRAPDGV